MDVLVVLTLLVSTALAIWRGFVRETLAVLAWAAAAFATLYFGPSLAHALKARFSTPYLGVLLAYAGIFVAVLIPHSFLSYRFSERVRNSPVGAVDRSLGGIFGAVRGLAVVGICYLAFSMVVPVPGQPSWITRARLFPLIQRSSDVLLSLVPARDAAEIQTASEMPVTADVPVPKPRPAGEPHRLNRTYGAQERHALDRLIQSTGSGGNNRP